MSAVDATRIEPALDATVLLQSTLPPREELAKTLSRSDLASSRRPSLMASLAGSAAPLPARYAEGDVLGKGGMGVVVLATDRDLARTVAVKKLKVEADRPEHLDRFLREAQVTAQLEHPGILPVHDVGVDEQGRFFYVMRLVRNDETLRRVIERLRAGDEKTHREFTFERRVRVIQKIAEILHYAHVKGVVHRDVKPENIMLGSFGEVYLVDWGLAKVSGMPASERPGDSMTVAPTGAGAGSVTQAGALVGTPLYMSPEQARGEPATPRSDIYALGAVLYELLCLHQYLGDTPSSVRELMDRIVSGKVVPAEKFYDAKNGRVPRFLSFIAQHALAKDPAARFATAKELEESLEGFLEGEGPICCPVTLQLRLMAVYRRAVHRHPMFWGFATMIIPGVAAIAYALHRFLG